MSGVVTAVPRLQLQLENAAILALSLSGFANTGQGWWLFAVLFFVPVLAVAVTIIWAGHIGFGRLFGYGLKYANAFGDTHLGRIGGAA